MNKEALKEIFAEQKSFQRNFCDIDNLDTDEKIKISKENILSAMRELSEVLNVLPWKIHRKYETYDIDKDELTEEVIDVFKFILNICIVWGIDEDEFLKVFLHKSLKVRERLEAEKDFIKGYDKKA